ncbi:MAG: hypothetical protein HZA04_10290 [Nitrospinae bacterium]|nr:hypothetical protein [Nitrospinota bacterium]
MAVFVNPVSGCGAGAKLHGRLKEAIAAERLLAENVASLQFTPRKGEEEQAADAIKKAETVFICGGDGTVHQFVNLMMKTQFAGRMAVFPIGTGNDFCASISPGGKDPIAFLRTIVQTPRTTSVDVFAVNGSVHFVNYASWGLDARILAVYEKNLPKFERMISGPLLSKKTFFAFVGLGELLAYHAKVRLGGERFTCIIASNLRSYAGGSVISKTSRTDDGMIEVMKLKSKGQFLRLILSRFFSGLGPESEPISPPVTFNTCPGAPVQVDGEDYTEFFKNTSAYTISREGALKVCA